MHSSLSSQAHVSCMQACVEMDRWVRQVGGQTPRSERSRARLPLQKVGTDAAYRLVLLRVDLTVALGENPVGFGQQGAHAIGIFLCKLNR